MIRFPKLLSLAFLLAALPAACAWADDYSFIHPGLLQTSEDFARMKAAIAAKQEPIYAGFQQLRAHPESEASYQMKGPRESVGRGTGWTGPIIQNFYDPDANAAYQCALMWRLTGDHAYAEKSMQILNAWSATLKTIGGRDAVLGAGLGPFKMINAAEIIRYSNAGWSDADIRQTEKCFREVVYPVIKDFAPFANGNWDTAAIKTVIALGVFCNDRDIFERGLRYCVHGQGNGRLTYYIINDAGQCQETGRDSQHSQLGLAHLADASEIAWNQGLNLYAYADNRLLRGFEYSAAHNAGVDVPFVEWMDRTGESHYLRPSAPGPYRMIYEQVYNHYVNRMGLAAPCTQQAAQSIRPEGQGVPGNAGINGADHTGFGTLLYSRPKAAAPFPAPRLTPAPPAALIAQPAPTGLQLTWIQSIGAATYTLKRAAAPGGPYVILAADLTSSSFTDNTVQPGRLYYYTASASNVHGESPNALEAALSAGLPPPWQQHDIGTPKPPGCALFDGQTFTLEAGGAEIGGTSDQLQFAAIPLAGDGTITARYVPQVSSQHLQFGLLMRESEAPDAPFVACLIQRAGGALDAATWNVALLKRAAISAATTQAAALPLGQPPVSDGRLMEPCWLRLFRAGNQFTAAFSPDGQQWTLLGTTTAPLNRELLLGIGACSRLVSPNASATTTVFLDHLSATGWTH